MEKTVTEIGKEYPEVELTHEYIDSAALKLIRMPWYYDVILTSNLLGISYQTKERDLPVQLACLVQLNWLHQERDYIHRTSFIIQMNQ